ncbi:hypothetical protein AKJ35_01410 [candidate division MSBL1 archaeon SCGC-AAA833F18]|uniref:Integrase catalytic domain-containing protein n=2 Tax=candidate division MSBL1 TaxID=215777 RepID=A0A133VRM5_9EURY|nr:hypothetical protein AKJ46_00970 [candidate division MSBL1 archaeon SCGC-AAA833K04]KXB09078.1 hypothetical protein AKJ35_01410 [candidate division MSBL1 archaeon SCGC-AAA833F18]
MLSVDTRRRIVESVEKGRNFSETAEIFATTRQTVSKWYKRWKNGEGLEDRSRRPKRIRRKVKDWHDRAIGLLRDAFNWGTERIRRALTGLPRQVRDLLEEFEIIIDPIELSRTTINKILKKLGVNGSPYQGKHEYKRFEMSESNELWQLDVKGPFRMEHEEYYAIFGLDDYSRFLVCSELSKSKPTTKDVTKVLQNSFKKYGKPKRVLIDRGSQFREEFKKFCERERIEIKQAPPNYPQIKGKIERFIRNFNEEFLVLQRVFAGLERFFPKWVDQYNYERQHMGIGNKPPATRYKPAKRK